MKKRVRGSQGAPGQASARLVRLLHGASFLNEPMLRQQIKEHLRSSPSREAETEKMLSAFRRMLEAAPCNAVDSLQPMRTLTQSETIPMAQASHDLRQTKSPAIDPEFMKLIVLCWLDMVDERTETILTELVQTRNLLDAIEAKAKYYSPEEVEDLRSQAQGLFNGYLSDLDVVRRQVKEVTTVLAKRRHGIESSGPRP